MRKSRKMLKEQRVQWFSEVTMFDGNLVQRIVFIYRHVCLTDVLLYQERLVTFRFESRYLTAFIFRRFFLKKPLKCFAN